MTKTATPAAAPEAPHPALLPKEKTPPQVSLHSSKSLIWGPPKIGKSTLAAGLDPDHTIFLATEPGLDFLEVFQVPVRTWDQFRKVGAELAEGNHDFKIAVVDTVDELQRMCAEHVIASLNSDLRQPKQGFVHPTDFEYGKGWAAVTEEFRLRVAKLCSLGLGVVFISHAKESTKKGRTGEEITVFSADVGAKGPRNWLLGYVDHILFATLEDGERVLRTQPTDTFEAGGRGAPLPDPLPLDAKALRDALEQAGKEVSG